MESKWIKPEEADVPGGEICVALYKGFQFPYFVYKNLSHNVYHPFPPLDSHDFDMQPDYILQLPPIPVKDEAD